MSDSQSSYPTAMRDVIGAIKTCPKCQGYMERYQIDALSKALLGADGKWHCLSCDYVQSSPTTAIKEESE